MAIRNPNNEKIRPHIVILGAGFGGMACARALRRVPARVTVVDQHNFHLFQPLLYQVATAALSPGDISMPIRRMLHRQANTRVVLGRVVSVDREKHLVGLASGHPTLAYDYLVVATGARKTYFGHDEWEPYAPPLKGLEDATAIRYRVLAALERAEEAEDAKERERWLSFVIIGGGTTGVEMAGAISALTQAEFAMRNRNLHGARARIVLIEGASQVLAGFPEPLVRKARRSLERLGVEVVTDAMAETCDAEGVTASGRRFEAGNLIWTAGVAASEAAKWLGADADKSGRVRVAPDLSLPGDPAIFVIGDTALVCQPNGDQVPGIAPPAKQEGTYVGKLLRDRLAGRPSPAPFHYRGRGELAAIGRNAAIVNFGWLRLSGVPGWLTWGVVHIFFLIGFRNRFVVAFSWLWAYFTRDYSARLILGHERRYPPGR